MKIIFSWDDGAKEDLKLFALHRKYAIPGIFFVPTSNREGRDVLSPQEIQENASDLISFGGHTDTHVYLTTVKEEDLDSEIQNNKKYLERILGHNIDHFCLPGGQYNENILKHVYSAYKTCRTAETVAFPDGSNLIRPTIHLYPRGKKSLIGNAIRHKHFGLATTLLFKSFSDYFDYVRFILNKYKNSNKTIVIWGHSWEIEELQWWDHVESLFKLISEEYKDCIAPYSDCVHQK